MELSEQRGRSIIPVELDSSDTASIVADNLIFATENGSRLYGTNVETSDRDIFGVFIEPPKFMIGTFSKLDNYKISPNGINARSNPGDLDITLFSLRKFMGLACSGNPSVLSILFAPEQSILLSTPFGKLIPWIAPKVVSKSVHAKFRGYLLSQKGRLIKEKAGHKPSRPEIIDRYGYDTKYAMHIIRLGLQGIELLSTGELQLPIQDQQAELLMRIRNGGLKQEDVLFLADELVERLDRALLNSKLPDRPDINAVESWMIDMYISHWMNNGYC